MDKLDLFKFFTLGAKLSEVNRLKVGADPGPAWFTLMSARWALDRLLEAHGSVITFSKERLIELRNRIDSAASIVNPTRESKGKALGKSEVGSIQVSYDRVEQLLSEELSHAAAYAVSKKGMFDTAQLVEFADDGIPKNLLVVLPEECRKDIRQGGRCLAFELPTASAFHMMRAVESVIRLYYQQVVGTLPKPKMRNWGAYVKNMRKKGGQEKILGTLEHIKNTYRNPVFHPEESLTTDEALVLFGVAVSAIVQMANALPAPAQNDRY